MTVPDSGTIDALEVELHAIGFLSGTAAALEDVAVKMAWSAAESYLGTNLLTGTVADEQHIWPRGWLDYDPEFRFIQLQKCHVLTITSALVTHDVGTCDCDLTDVAACLLVHNPRTGVVEVRASLGSVASGCSCILDSKPVWVTVTYVAGLWNSLGDMPDDVKFAIAILTSEFVALAAGGGAGVNAGFVTQWSSMDYSESLGLLQTSILGSSPAANWALRLLRPYKVRRMVGFRGRPSVTG